MDQLRDSRQADALSQVEITPAMIEAGEAVFEAWFMRDEHSQSLVELPSSESIGSLVASSFEAMLALMPESLRN